MIVNRHADLRAGVAITGDVAGELLNVRDNLDRSRTSGRAANPAVIGDMEAAQTALVGAYDQFPVMDKIEANPEVVGLPAGRS